MEGEPAPGRDASGVTSDAASRRAGQRRRGLVDLIDVAAVQSLMDDFHAVARIPMSVIDLEGRILVGVGWQRICSDFHRANAEACGHCVDSDTRLTTGVRPGEFRIYRCANRMWDAVTPIVVAGEHVGNVFSGQFFFDDEEVDREGFREQARRYGFDEAAYLEALDEVPRLARSTVRSGMSFLVKLAGMLSTLGRSNLALRESQQDLKRAQAVAMTGSWRLDTRRNELHWSDETYRIFGISPGTPLTYEAFLGCVHPEDRARVDAAWNAALAGGGYDIEHRVVVDGDVRWVRERAELERDESGVLVGGFGTVQDITRLKRSEEGLRELNETLEARVAERTAEVEAQAVRLRRLAVQLAQAEQNERTRLAKLLHDELQQLLVAAKIQASVAARWAADPRAVEALVRLEKLLGESIETSRALTAELSPLVLHERGLIPALEWLARRVRERQHLDVTLVADPVAEPADSTVRAALYEAVRELLLNVVKHAEVRAARVEVTRIGSEVSVVVSDAGRGFEPAVVIAGDGSGFGLFGTRERIEHLGGRMAVTSAPGVGTSVSITVPAGGGPLPASPAGDAARLRPEKDRAGGRIRVLLVDDHAVFRQGLAAMIGLEPDIEVAGQASNGREALDAVAAIVPDVVVMDVSMPVMDGLEATCRIRADHPSVRVVALSLHETVDMAQAMIDAGAVAYVSKAGPADAVLRAIRQAAFG